MHTLHNQLYSLHCPTKQKYWKSLMFYVSLAFFANFITNCFLILPVAAEESKPKYTCSECGKHYATSSNLSRHRQTHRTLDSGNAKKCQICNKMYVSMPALSMHVLTHNLNHKCDVCGKAFSRPWLLQVLSE